MRRIDATINSGIPTPMARAFFFCVYADVCVELRHKHGLPPIDMSAFGNSRSESLLRVTKNGVSTFVGHDAIGDTIVKKIDLPHGISCPEAWRRTLFHNFASHIFTPGEETICLIEAEETMEMSIDTPSGLRYNKTCCVRADYVATRTSRVLEALVDITEPMACATAQAATTLTITVLRLKPTGLMHPSIVQNALASERLKRALDYCAASLVYDRMLQTRLKRMNAARTISALEEVWDKQFADSFQSIDTYLSRAYETFLK